MLMPTFPLCHTQLFAFPFPLSLNTMRPQKEIKPWVVGRDFNYHRCDALYVIRISKIPYYIFPLCSCEKHYIPVASDFSDLAKTVRYVVDPRNSQQMQQIIKNSQQFCRTKLTMEQYTVDILWTLLSYAELLANSPDFHDTWRRDEGAYEMTALAMRPWKPRASTQNNSSTQ
jgi:hypothetical protein